MCGFLAEFTFNDCNLSSSKDFEDLLALSKHRGPDSTLIHTEKTYRLGFNRLAILDLSAKGNQPKYSPSKRYHVVFNGEIYNFKALEQQYALTGLESTSDTEVLLHLLDLLGVEKCIEHLNGMFAMVIVDTIKEIVYLIRDFAGIKPLFYGVSEQGVVAASQFNQVFKHSWFKKNLQLSPEHMKAYFGTGFMQSPNTIYENIFQVNPGAYIKIHKDSTIKIKSFKKFQHLKTKAINDDDPVLISEIELQLDAAVKRQLVSDVPLASFLSGGIDSPLITALSKKHQSEIKAFTLAVKDKTLDESAMAKAYARSIKVIHDISTFDTDELLEHVDIHFQKLGEPFGDYSSLPTFLITKKAKEKHTVMLSGDGGDELFFGYPRMLHIMNNRYWFYLPFPIRRPIIRLAIKLKLTQTWGPFTYRSLDEWVRSKHYYILKDDLNKMFPNAELPIETSNPYHIKIEGPKKKVLQLLRINEFYGHLQRILIKVDRMSMANSLEVRVPFLDQHVIEHAFKYHPYRFKKKVHLKSILKCIMQHYYPKSIITSDKKGFTIPISDWLLTTLHNDVNKVIFNTPIYGASQMDSSMLKKFVSDFYDSKHFSAWGVWHIYAWQKWAIIEGHL